MSGIILLFFILALCYNNGELARRKGVQPIGYAILTGVLFFVFIILGVFFVIGMFGPDLLNVPPTAANDPVFKQMYAQRLARFFDENYLRELSVELIALGGYLLVRFIIEQKPGKKQDSEMGNLQGE